MRIDSLREKWRLAERITSEIIREGRLFSYPPGNTWKPLLLPDIRKAWKGVVQKPVCSGEGLGLYVHIPFCLSKCTYCCIRSQEENDPRMHERYLDALEAEIRLLDFPRKGAKFKTVYIGGGTPSIFSPRQLSRLFTAIYNNFDCKDACQVMVEVSPSTVTRAKIKVLKDFGVNKITLGIQTTNASLLKRLKRTGQTEAVVREAYGIIRKAGIKYVNVDLIAGLPYETRKSFFRSLDTAIKLRPDTIHINAFYPGPTTGVFQPGYKLSGREVENRDRLVREAYARMSGECPGTFERHGDPKENMQFYHYKKLHNPVLGLGCGAISHAVGQLQYETAGSVKSYIENISAGDFPAVAGVAMNFEAETRAYTISCLESEAVVPKRDFKNIFGVEFDDIFSKEIIQLEKLGVVSMDAENFRLNLTDTAQRLVCSKFFYGPLEWQLLKKKLRNRARGGRVRTQGKACELPQNPDYMPEKSVVQGSKGRYGETRLSKELL